MIGFVLVGTNEMIRAMHFYDTFFDALGAKRLYQMTHGGVGVMYGLGDGPTFGVVEPFDGQPATAGNGTMVAFESASPEDVDRLHALALSLGGTDEGTPGPRGDGTAYCAYFRDPDDNKLCIYCNIGLAPGRADS